MWDRHSPPGYGRFLLGVFLVLVLFLHDSAGMAWDDAVQAEYGERSLNFFLSLGQDRAFLDLFNLHYYGAVFETLSAGLHRLLGEEPPYAYRGLLCGLAALAAAHWVVCLMRSAGLGRVGWFAGLFLLTTPQFWGHAFVNSKDIPMAAAYVLWWFCYFKWCEARFQSRKWLVLCGLSLGCVLAIRVAGLPFIGFTVMAGGVAWMLEDEQQGKPAWRRLAGFPWKAHLLVLGIGWCLMILTWPYALLNPLVNPATGFFMFLEFPHRIHVTLLGEWFRSDALPGYAFALEQFLSHPLWAYPLYGLGVAGIWRFLKSDNRRNRFLAIAVLLWLVPLFAIFPIKPFNMYHGVRQSLFLWPAYAVLAAIGLATLIEACRRISLRPAWPLILGTAGLVANVLLLLDAHPFSYNYRNPVVRLLPGGVNGFDNDYQALSYRLAARWLDRVALERLHQGRPPPSVIVFSDQYAGPSYSRYATVPKPTDFAFQAEVLPYVDNYDYLLILHPFQNRPDLIDLFHLEERQVAHQIEHRGRVFAVIYW